MRRSKAKQSKAKQSKAKQGKIKAATKVDIISTELYKNDMIMIIIQHSEIKFDRKKA